MRNLKTADKHNLLERQNNGGAVHGLTVFADMSLDEFHASQLGSKAMKITSLAPDYPQKENRQQRYTGSDTVMDWTGILTTPVKDQGLCGACW